MISAKIELILGVSNSIAFLGAILAPIMIGLLKDWIHSSIWGFYFGAMAMALAFFMALRISGHKPGSEPTI